MNLSIVVATNARPSQLSRLINSLTPQTGKDTELIVIENSYGLAKARNQGWRKARGKYIAFIDDDAVADPGWVEAILDFVDSHTKEVIFGGPYTSLNQSEIPSWIPREVTEKILPSKKARPLKLGQEWLNGTNFVVKKSALEVAGGFDEKLGITSAKRAYGEETDLQIRLHNKGYEVWYDPQIKVRHEFARFKMNMCYLLKNQFTHGYNSSQVFKHLAKSTPGKTATKIFRKLISKGISPKTRFYYLVSPLFYLAGGISSKLSKVQ